MLAHSSFLTQNEEENEDIRNQEEEEDDDISMDEEFNLSPDPVARNFPLSPSSSSAQLIRQLVTRHEEKIQDIYLNNRREFATSMQQSLKEVQIYYEEKLLQKEVEIENLKHLHNHQLLEKEENINSVHREKQYHNTKWENYREKLVETKFEHYQSFASPFSLKNMLHDWQDYIRKEKEFKRKEKMITKLTDQSVKQRFFYLLVNNFQTNKKNLQFTDLKFKYDTLSNEVGNFFRLITFLILIFGFLDGHEIRKRNSSITPRT
jgi:hypothetical protein